MNTSEKFNCVFNHYPERILISNKRMAKYYVITDLSNKAAIDKLQKYIIKGISTGKYQWVEKGKYKDGIKRYALYDRDEKCFLVKNKALAGTPRYKTINSQDVWESGAGAEWAIRKLKESLFSYFAPSISRQLPEKIILPDKRTFIHLEYIFFYPFESRPKRMYQDILNHFYVRGKVFEDTLTYLGIITDDSPEYVRGAYARYVNVNSEEDRRLEVKIHFCRNGERIH